MKNTNKPLSGLQKVCKLYGRMKCGKVMMVWDYANEMAVQESAMRPGSKRWSRSEKTKGYIAQTEAEIKRLISP